MFGSHLQLIGDERKQNHAKEKCLKPRADVVRLHHVRADVPLTLTERISILKPHQLVVIKSTVSVHKWKYLPFVSLHTSHLQIAQCRKSSIVAPTEREYIK